MFISIIYVLYVTVLTPSDLDRLGDSTCAQRPRLSPEVSSAVDCLRECSQEFWCNALTVKEINGIWNCGLYKECSPTPEAKTRLFVVKN